MLNKEDMNLVVVLWWAIRHVKNKATFQNTRYSNIRGGRSHLINGMKENWNMTKCYDVDTREWTSQKIERKQTLGKNKM